MTGWAFLALAVVALLWFLVERGRRRVHAVEPGLHEEIDLEHRAEWELWHNDFSLCSRKVRVCLAELGIEYVAHHVDLVETGRYGNLDPDFLRVNPAATVPVLVHRGHPVYESHEQIRHAARFAAPGRSLVPESAAERAEMEHWVERAALIGDDPMASLDRSAGNCVPALTFPLFAAMNAAIPWRRFLVGLLFHRLRLRPIGMMIMKLRGPGGVLRLPPLRAAMGRSHAALARHLDALEDTLGSRTGPWLLGAQFTLADVGLMVLFDRLDEGGWLDGLLRNRPRVSQYWQALQGRESFRSAVAERRHPAVVAGMAALAAHRERDPGHAALLAGEFSS